MSMNLIQFHSADLYAQMDTLHMRKGARQKTKTLEPRTMPLATNSSEKKADSGQPVEQVGIVQFDDVAEPAVVLERKKMTPFSSHAPRGSTSHRTGARYTTRFA